MRRMIRTMLALVLTTCLPARSDAQPATTARDGGTRAETDPRGMLDEADVECRTGEQARAERREPLERRRHARG